MRLLAHEFEILALKTRGEVSGGFCRRKGYTDSAARRVLNSHWSFLARGMKELGIIESDVQRKEFSDSFWEAFRPQ
jgi:hypothetical protein